MSAQAKPRPTPSTSVIARLVRATHCLIAEIDSWIARIKRAMTAGRGSSGARVALILMLAFAVSSCGVKNDLVLPDGKPSPKGEKDPSKPPQQQER